MPAVFTAATVIGAGWRCNPGLGAYFRKVAGQGFRFNAAMRDFIHNGAGRTLGGRARLLSRECGAGCCDAGDCSAAGI